MPSTRLPSSASRTPKTLSKQCSQESTQLSTPLKISHSIPSSFSLTQRKSYNTSTQAWSCLASFWSMFPWTLSLSFLWFPRWSLPPFFVHKTLNFAEKWGAGWNQEDPTVGGYWIRESRRHVEWTSNVDQGKRTAQELLQCLYFWFLVDSFHSFK